MPDCLRLSCFLYKLCILGFIMSNSDRARRIEFVLAYVDHWDGPRAVREAGFTEGHVSHKARNLLDDPEIQEMICDAVVGRLKRLRANGDYVLRELMDMWEADVGDILDTDGYVRPLGEWPTIWKRMLNGFENVELFDGKGEDRAKVADLKKLKWVDRGKIIELIGKHTDVGAWTERRELTGKDGSPLIPKEVSITRRVVRAEKDDDE